MSASTSSTAPNTTLYVKNIASKIKKDELRRQLFCLFVTYGKVLDVVATRASGMRGQAFVVFQDLASSTAALRGLDGFSFYGQPLTLDYAKSKSKATIVLEKGHEALLDPAIVASLSKASKVTFSSAGADLQGRERKRAREEAGQRGEVRVADSSDEDEGDAGGAIEHIPTANGDPKRDADGQPKEKRRKSGATTTNGNGAADSDEEEEEMQMDESDDDDDEGERPKANGET